jgi:ABC-2 type transport system permease protein
MMRDIRTVMWKEWKNLHRQRGSRTKSLLTLLVPLAVFGVYVPWDANDHWLRGIPPFFAAAAIPLVLALLVVPDSFAGERERRTLSTLLASRLPDRAILVGKAMFGVVLSWVAALLVLAIGLVTVNVTHWAGHVQGYASHLALGAPALALLLAGLGVGAGILISLRSVSVQEAQQTLTVALFIPPTILGPAILLLGRKFPEYRPRLLLAGSQPEQVLAVALGTLLILNVIVFAAVIRRFRRSSLILNS